MIISTGSRLVQYLAFLIVYLSVTVTSAEENMANVLDGGCQYFDNSKFGSENASFIVYPAMGKCFDTLISTIFFNIKMTMCF